MSSPALVHEPKIAEVRSLAEGANSLALLREIQALEVLYYVGKRKPITDLTPEQQARVREAYRDTHWASDYGIEAQGVFTTKELAEEVCRRNGPNWFYHALPINSCLPDETVFFRAHVFPGSDARVMYENLEGATMAVPVTTMRALQEEIEHLQSQLDSVRELILPSP